MTMRHLTLGLLIGMLALAACSGTPAATLSVPAADSAEVGFARDMIVHHTQAIDMANLLYDRTDDETLRFIARDIVQTQVNQIGQMQAWLALWGHPFADTGPRMAWMDMATDDLMPGMATPEQMEALRAASGTQAEILFLNMMIPHHAAGVHMAETVIGLTEQPVVRDLARSMAEGQVEEIDLMQSTLEALGEPRFPQDEIDALMNMEMHDH